MTVVKFVLFFKLYLKVFSSKNVSYKFMFFLEILFELCRTGSI